MSVIQHSRRIAACIACAAPTAVGGISVTPIQLAEPLAVGLVVTDISGDGSTAVGIVQAPGELDTFFRWTEAEQGVFVGPTLESFTNAINAHASVDGGVVVGSRVQANNAGVVRWRETTGDHELHNLGNGLTAYGISPDGETIAGTAGLGPGGVRVPVRYTPGERVDVVGLPSGYAFGEARRLSDDTTRMAATFWAPTGDPGDPFRPGAAMWDEASGSSFIEFDAALGVIESRAWLISGDGGTVAGTLENDAGESLAFARTSEGVRLLDGAGWTQVYDATPDASIITGLVVQGGVRRAVVWTEATGTVPIRDLLGDASLVLPAQDGGPLMVSDNGRSFVGNFGNGPYHITIPAPASAGALLGVVSFRRRGRPA